MPAHGLLMLSLIGLFVPIDAATGQGLTPNESVSTMRLQDRLGMLQSGHQADIVLLKHERGSFPLEDAEHQVRIASERLVPVSVCKRGLWTSCVTPVAHCGSGGNHEQ